MFHYKRAISCITGAQKVPLPPNRFLHGVDFCRTGIIKMYLREYSGEASMTSTRILVTRILLCAFCVCLLASCRLPWKQAHTNANLAKQPKPTTQQLLANLQKNFRTVKTFHVL